MWIPMLYYNYITMKTQARSFKPTGFGNLTYRNLSLYFQIIRGSKLFSRLPKAKKRTIEVPNGIKGKCKKEVTSTV